MAVISLHLLESHPKFPKSFHEKADLSQADFVVSVEWSSMELIRLCRHPSIRTLFLSAEENFIGATRWCNNLDQEPPLTGNWLLASGRIPNKNLASREPSGTASGIIVINWYPSSFCASFSPNTAVV